MHHFLCHKVQFYVNYTLLNMPDIYHICHNYYNYVQLDIDQILNIISSNAANTNLGRM